MAASGVPQADIARSLGLPTSTVHRWVSRAPEADAQSPAECFRCLGERSVPAAARAYAYLFGQYLGDGHLVTRAKVPVLRITACTDYPAIITEIEAAIEAVRHVRPGRVRLAGKRALNVQSYWMHWPCLFPQHGPGRKHQRPIVLAGWQQRLVAAHPWPFLRGLIHSDGCRATNRVVVRGKRYEYPRYFLSNESADILAVAGRTLDQLGVQWRYSRPSCISVARRSAVSLMDEHIGPKR